MSKHVFYVGDVLTVLKTLPSESVHCVVTSPPYWNLRDYGVEGQIGLESTPEEYVDRLVAVFREVKRVLRNDGVLFLNLGDSYYSDFGGVSSSCATGNREALCLRGRSILPKHPRLKPKDLVGIPWMVAFALRDDGWWLRSDCIWAKPNSMPESVRDRPAKAHEYIFLLSKSCDYFYDAEAIREPQETASKSQFYDPDNMPTAKTPTWGIDGSQSLKFKGRAPRLLNPAGRNKRSVWWIPTEPFPHAHFATFPQALVEPCILAGTSERGCCPKCGAPWERVTKRRRPEDAKPKKATEPWSVGAGLKPHRGYRGTPIVQSIGWRPTCFCGVEETAPATVLDPFGGAGTVSLVAKKLGRNSIYIDLNPDYCDMAIRRLEPEKQPLFEPCEVRREVIA